MYRSNHSTHHAHCTHYLLIVLCTIGVLTACTLETTTRPAFTGNRRVLAIGMDYPNRQASEQLHYAGKDATNIGEALAQQGYEVDRVIISVPDPVSKSTILQALEDSMQNSVPEDILVVFIAGHTHAVDDTWEIQTEDNQGISATELLQKLASAPCPVVLLLDCCHAGVFVPDDSHSHDTQYLSNGPGYTHPVSTSIGDALTALLDSSRKTEFEHLWVLAASGYHEQSFEPDPTDPSTDAEGLPIENGFFTHYLLQGLVETQSSYHKADADHNGIIMLSELFAYIKQSYAANPYPDQPLPRVSGTVLDVAFTW